MKVRGCAVECIMGAGDKVNHKERPEGFQCGRMGRLMDTTREMQSKWVLRPHGDPTRTERWSAENC